MFPLLTRIDKRHLPLGLVGIIAPWNYPLSPTISDGLAALVAGNAVLLKPDLQTPYVALAAVDLLREVGLPADLWQVVYGAGDQVGPELIYQVDYLCFTGSTATGQDRRPAVRRAADRLLAGAGREEPAAGAGRRRRRARRRGRGPRARFGNAGQLCVSDRADLRGRRAARRLHRVRSWPRPGRCGWAARSTTSTTWAAWSAPTSSTGSRQQVEDARSKGAQVLTGGRRRPDLGPLFYEPTVLTGVTDGDGLLRRRDLRPGGQHLPRTRRGRGDRSGRTTPSTA